MKPWEKPCTSGSIKVDMDAGRVTHYPRCPACHGTGYVPMTTSEMLEALRERLPLDGLMSLTYAGAEPDEWELVWEHELRSHTRPWPGRIIIERLTPDEALRAALQAVAA